MSQGPKGAGGFRVDFDGQASVSFRPGPGTLVGHILAVLADETGYVRHPDIDLSQEMTDMIIAQRGYQANLAVVQRATEAYQAALRLGR